MQYLKTLVVIIALLPWAPTHAQDVDIDVLELFLTLDGEWQGELVLEQGKDESISVGYELSAKASGGQALVQEHRFAFPKGAASAVEVLTYDQDKETLLVSYFNGRKRYVTDLKVTSASLGENDSWRVLTEHEDTYGETTVSVRNLYQLEGDLFTKFRWVKDGEDYILSDSVTLKRVKP
ncbi:MAG: hypothetical protein PVF65_07030 [Sphingomonadales bacterium]|jgi:hypothetical protein